MLLLGAIVSFVCGVITMVPHFFLLGANLALLLIPATRIFKDQEAQIDPKCWRLSPAWCFWGLSQWRR